jgi:hypothetical protein
MTNPQPKDPFAAAVLASQIIIGALIAGPIPLLAIAYFIGPMLASPQPGAAQAGAPAGQPSDERFRAILEYTAMGAGAMAVLMSFIVPRVISSSGRRSVAQSTHAVQPGRSAPKGAKLQTMDEQRAKLLPQFQSQLIVRAAILEGAAFFATVVYLLTGNPIVAGAAILLLVGMLAVFPTRARVDLWLERQQEKLRDEEFTQSSV